MDLVDNVKYMQDWDCSFGVEIAPRNGSVECIDEIKDHLFTSVIRDGTEGKAILTRYARKEYVSIYPKGLIQIFLI